MTSRYERAIDTKLDILRSMGTEEYRSLTEHSLLDRGQADLSIDEFVMVNTNIIQNGKVYYIPDEMGRILEEAANQLPTFTLQAHDIPTKQGFMYLETPIHEEAHDSVNDFDMYHRAVGWEVMEGDNAVLVLYYAYRDDIMPWLNRILDQAEARAVLEYGAEATLTKQQRIDWICKQAPLWATFHWTVIDLNVETTLEVQPNNMHARYLLATWFMLNQEALEPVEQSPPRQARKRAAKAKTDSNLTVLYLRGMRHSDQHSPTAGEPRGKLTHRFPVSGHWRRQWYRSEQRHKPKWIAPYIKGPDDGELVITNKVTVLKP